MAIVMINGDVKGVVHPAKTWGEVLEILDRQVLPPEDASDQFELVRGRRFHVEPYEVVLVLEEAVEFFHGGVATKFTRG